VPRSREPDRAYNRHLKPAPICGFAQAQDIQRVHHQVMPAKFESLAEGARLASRELRGR